MQNIVIQPGILKSEKELDIQLQAKLSCSDKEVRSCSENLTVVRRLYLSSTLTATYVDIWLDSKDYWSLIGLRVDSA